jgi:hypothetical protein
VKGVEGLFDVRLKVYKAASPVFVKRGAARHGDFEHFSLYRLCD